MNKKTKEIIEHLYKENQKLKKEASSKNTEQTEEDNELVEIFKNLKKDNKSLTSQIDKLFENEDTEIKPLNIREILEGKK